MRYSILVFTIGLMLLSCTQQNRETPQSENQFTGKDGEVNLIVLAPGHFHANLLQKSAIAQVNDTVAVYAVSSEDVGLKQYLCCH